MATIPEPSKSTAKAIHWLYEQKKDEPRPHMGCSIIGHACDKYIWLTWRWVLEESFPGRIKRLFDTGKREEERLLSDLKEIGVELHTEDNGKQIGVAAHDGHLAGSVDGIGRGFIEAPKSWAVLECKTHNEKSFAELQKKGVRQAKVQHFVQMQMYMGLLSLDRSMYLAQGKNDDSLYSEWVHFDKEVFDHHMARAERLLKSSTPPEGISVDPSWYECKWCNFYDHCHGEKIAQVNCRTCVHSTPVKDAAWRCEAKSKPIKFTDQIAGCSHHLYIPDLIPFANAVDGSDNHIEYKKADGTTFTNGQAPGQFKSLELSRIDPSIPGDKFVQEMKDTFGAEVIPNIFDMADDLEPVYSEDNSAKGKKAKAELAKTAAQVKALKGLK
jgi:hypothetical protein